MGKIVAFHVEFRLPPGATPAAARAYIESALLTERGFLRPEDPMSEFDGDSIEIRHRDPLSK
jgi:hypothetical protein